MKIGIDCGHCISGMDTGAIGNGYKEQDLTREIGNLVMNKLKALGHTVVNCTCNSANSVGESLNYRVNTADNNNVNLFVSIHINAGGGTGSEVYTWNAKQLPEAQRVLNNLNILGFRNRGIKNGNHLRVIKSPDAVAMLIECFFIDTKADVDLYKSVGADKIANAIVQGLTGETIIGSSSTDKTSIVGKSILDAESLAQHVLNNNPKPKLNCSILELAQLYLAEGAAENIRGDIAFCQAIKETGYFKYGGDVLYEQNNYAGIGATNALKGQKGKGAWFNSPKQGVRAQIQHLKAYANKEPLVNSYIVDPRFNLVTRGVAPNWEDLNGKWAVPGSTYGQDILKIYKEIKSIKIDKKEILKENKIDKKLIEEQLYSVECSINNVTADNLTIIEKLKANTENLATDLKAVQDLKKYINKNLK